METYERVSLGFAEFVAQLLQETYEATLSAQTYQIDRYLELENSQHISTKEFVQKYIDPEELIAHEHHLFGAEVSEDLPVTAERVEMIGAAAPDIPQKRIVKGGKFTKRARRMLKAISREQLVQAKRAVMLQLLQKSDQVRLQVDSGEIRAKLELSNLSQETAESDAAGLRKARVSGLKTPQQEYKGVEPLDPAEPEAKDGRPKLTEKMLDVDGVKIRKISSEGSEQSILLIDKSSLREKAANRHYVPTVRLIAAPAQVTSTTESNLYSEVTIKWKII